MMARRRKGGKTISRPGRAYDADVAARSSYDARFQAKLDRIKRRQQKQGVQRAITDSTQTVNSKSAAVPRSWARRIFVACGWCAWLLVVWLLSSLIVSLPVVLLRRLADYDALTDVVGVAIMQVAQLLLMLVMLIVIPGRLSRSGRQFGQRSVKWQNRCQLLGVCRRPNRDDVIPLLASIVGYYLIGFAVTALASLVLPTNLMTQAQDVGFTGLGGGWWQAILIVLILAVITPIFEELIFRGFLLGKVQALLGFWPAAILVSLLFAMAHGQVNVGLTTFILSMIACYDRHRMGAIWVGMGLHMVVNLLAATLVFVMPLL